MLPLEFFGGGLWLVLFVLGGVFVCVFRKKGKVCH